MHSPLPKIRDVNYPAMGGSYSQRGYPELGYLGCGVREKTPSVSYFAQILEGQGVNK